MKVAIIGSRSLTNYELFKVKCDTILSSSKSITIISGGAKGTDRLAERYAAEKNIPILIYKADWDLHGRSAGMKRNTLMLNDCTHVIAFWDRNSPGTLHMINQSRICGKKLRIIKFK
jgi:hypothetical protein